MSLSFPFLTAYDPPGSGEGTLDPLGLYQLADRLAIELVPVVRERMQRIRFLTAMTVGSMVLGIDDDQRLRDASPYLVWEWLVIEALVRTMPEDPSIWGAPGTLVAKRALKMHGYLDARSYLKTPRIFGFHGVYKRLAEHFGLVTVDLEPGPNADKLFNAWASGLGHLDAKSLVDKWKAAVSRSLRERPPRTKTGWTTADWAELANAFAPSRCKSKERVSLREMLHASDERSLGALPAIWHLQERFNEQEFQEERLHERLANKRPEYAALLASIRDYEEFARGLQDGFDLLLAEAAKTDSNGFVVPTIATDKDFQQSVTNLHERFAIAHRALGEIGVISLELQNLFKERFQIFAEPLEAAACAISLCEHHSQIQSAKSAEGKRPWFDRIGQDRIYVRHAYREKRRDIRPGRYVHDYRGRPIGRFRADLS